MFLSVVAPCLNEAEGLEEFYQRLYKSIQSANISDYEIILIDDGSKDPTWEIIKLLHQKDRCVRGIMLSRNFGHQSALAAGLHEATGKYIFIIDSDLQDPPELLLPMLRKIKFISGLYNPCIQCEVSDFCTYGVTFNQESFHICIAGVKGGVAGTGAGPEIAIKIQEEIILVVRSPKVYAANSGRCANAGIYTLDLGMTFEQKTNIQHI